MSGVSDNIECPKCGGKDSLYTSSDDRDYMCNLGFCLNCGYSYQTVEEQLPLDEVNSERGEWDLPPLEKLPETRFQKRLVKEERKRKVEENRAKKIPRPIDLMVEYPIFFSDLIESSQKTLLLFCNITSPEDFNWDGDVIPVAILPKPELSEDNNEEET